MKSKKKKKNYTNEVKYKTEIEAWISKRNLLLSRKRERGKDKLGVWE